MPATPADAGARAALVSLLGDPRWEVLPLASTPERVAALPAGATVTVTASPGKRIEATTELARSLAGRGFHAVPHLAARMIRDRQHLTDLVGALAAAGVREAFVIGGDARASGAYPDAGSLLRDLAEIDHPFVEVGIAAYPQGHPLIPPDRLQAALVEKATMATYMTTQICFDADALAAWLRTSRAAGIGLPVHVGIPGVLRAHRLLEISARIGVTDARRFVRGNLPLAGRLLRPRGYRPDRLLSDIAPLLADRDANVRQLHVYTFNQVGATHDWLSTYAATLSGGAPPT